MYYYLIQKHVEKLTKEEIEAFAIQHGITLKEEETEVFLFYIKRNWKTILYGNPKRIFEEVKPKLEPKTYQKMIELYQFFKEKYQNYL